MAGRGYEAYDVLPEAVLVVDREGTIVYANGRAGEVLGCPSSGLPGVSVLELSPERDRAAHMARIAEFFGAQEQPPAVRLWNFSILRSTGEEILAEVGVAAMPDRDRAVVLLRDRTEVARAEEALRRSEERFRVAAETCADIIWEACVETDRLDYFGDIDGLLGYGPGEFPRTITAWAAAVHPEDAPAVAEAEERGKAEGFYAPRAYRMRRRNGTWVYIEERARFLGSETEPFDRFIGAARDVTARVLAEQEMARTVAELRALRERLAAENVALRADLDAEQGFDEIVGESAALKHVLGHVARVAETEASVLITGETGTGKELVARAIHRRSGRCDRPLVKVNCAALPESLIESELFGHEKGAFTGALARKIGRFELADGGTIFLDEIGDLPLGLQAKLLRVLQEGEFERIGSTGTTRVDVRVIAATNRDLPDMLEEGTFRTDLYYRLGVFPIEIPALRERREDIPLLVWYFVSRIARGLGKEFREISPVDLARLTRHPWVGNVRELRNVIERSMILAPGPVLEIAETLGGEASDPEPEKAALTMEDVQREHILQVLEDCGWRVKGVGNAAETLGMKPATLRYRMQKLGIERP